MQNRHVLVGRNQIDAVWFDPRPVFDLKNFHRDDASKQFVHDSFVRRVQMLDDDKGHAARRGHFFQELFKGLQASGGGADTDDRKRSPFCLWRVFSQSGLFFLCFAVERECC